MMPISGFSILDATRDADFCVWDRLVDQAPTPDVYYRPSYALACREENTEMVCALVVEAAGFRFLVPILVSHPCGGNNNPLSWKVAYSPYGYGGLLSLNDSAPPNCEQVAALRQTLQSFARERGVVCLVLRMHPILAQDLWFKGEGIDQDAILIYGSSTVSLDLLDWNEQEQSLPLLKKGRRSDLRLARRRLKVGWSHGRNPEMLESLRTFQTIYNARMHELEARDFYFFPDQYYSALASGLRERLAVALAWSGNDAVAGALFMADARYGHYHLSATDSIGQELKAATLLVNAGANWARQQGCCQLHLGGGIAEEDTLFQFKKSFGGNVFRYATLTVIAEHAAFRALCDNPNPQWPFNIYGRVRTSGALSGLIVGESIE